MTTPDPSDLPPPPPTALPDVKYVTIEFELVGAFMVAMAQEEAADFPTTVADFMRMLSNYCRQYAQTLSEEPGSAEPAPAIVFDDVEGSTFAAQFIPHDTPELPGLGIWEVDSVLRVLNVREDATMALFQNRADHVNIRLPERGNIGAKVLLAQELQHMGGKFPNMPYIEPYFDDRMTAMQFVWANVGDYTTRSCR